MHVTFAALGRCASTKIRPPFIHLAGWALGPVCLPPPVGVDTARKHEPSVAAPMRVRPRLHQLPAHGRAQSPPGDAARQQSTRVVAPPMVDAAKGAAGAGVPERQLDRNRAGRRAEAEADAQPKGVKGRVGRTERWRRLQLIGAAAARRLATWPAMPLDPARTSLSCAFTMSGSPHGTRRQ